MSAINKNSIPKCGLWMNFDAYLHATIYVDETKCRVLCICKRNGSIVRRLRSDDSPKLGANDGPMKQIGHLTNDTKKISK